jgi:hypothetical protein
MLNSYSGWAADVRFVKYPGLANFSDPENLFFSSEGRTLRARRPPI